MQRKQNERKKRKRQHTSLYICIYVVRYDEKEKHFSHSKNIENLFKITNHSESKTVTKRV